MHESYLQHKQSINVVNVINNTYFYVFMSDISDQKTILDSRKQTTIYQSNWYFMKLHQGRDSHEKQEEFAKEKKSMQTVFIS